MPAELYLQAFSSRLSSNWPSRAGCARTKTCCPQSFRSVQVGCTLMATPALKMVADPGDEIDLLEVGHPGFRIGASEEEQGLDDPPEPQGIGVQPVENALVLLDCPPPPAARRRWWRPRPPAGFEADVTPDP